MNENFEKWIAFLKPENLKDNLICCSIYIAFFETTKDYIVNQVRDFYSIGWSLENGDLISDDYKTYVLSKDKDKNPVKASLIWFKENNAITDEDILVYDELRKYRNVIAHEMLEKLFDGINKDYGEKLNQLVELRIKLERWWIFNIEMETGMIENPENIKEDVISNSQMIFKLIFDIVSGDEEKSNYYYNEFMKYKAKNS
ncbi:hypothetical protein EQG68_11690 [Flavobacterium piscinae]|uniref:Uncharacterized protein n=1 Tax=Flavobacterium piscinae TaxID=2506424 RepID=A0A4V1N3W5_9FLAO|nr:hypothetical protein [Flavobacterium piscinae]RXR30086.1 hypothetical protein EQG68_11690 [Flavobacterium piscinae]